MRKLAKLHANGQAHGHVQRNTIVVKNNIPYLIDPSLLRSTEQHYKNTAKQTDIIAKLAHNLAYESHFHSREKYTKEKLVKKTSDFRKQLEKEYNEYYEKTRKEIEAKKH